jgi:uncharacterized coiled-coil protein SlyX
MKTERIKSIVGSPWRRGFILIPLVFASLAVPRQARAVCQEGCDPFFNTYLGEDALINNTGGLTNTAIGGHALFSNTTASANTATGYNALYFTTGEGNTGTGYNALYSNTTADGNTAIGYNTMFSNTTGTRNAAVGNAALYYNNNGSGNVAIGAFALFNNITGSNNIAIGASGGSGITSGSNNIDIGAYGVAGESNTIRIGSVTTPATATYIQGISGATVSRGVPVLVAAGGRLGTLTSSARFKEVIKPMDKASEVILALKPVTFRYKKHLDPEGIPQFGLVAEDVEKVSPDLVTRNDKGETETVRYEAVNAMLLNEFLKEHRKVEEQQATITELKSTVAQQQKDFQATAAHQQKQIEALTAGLQRVSAELATASPSHGGLEVNGQAPQMVSSNQ